MDIGLRESVPSSSSGFSCRGLSFRFEGSSPLSFPDLELKAPGLYFIVGPNGSGKSTFLRLVSGLEPSFEGKASLFGEEKPSAWAEMASYVSQEPIAFEEKSVLGNLLLPTGKKGLSYAEKLLEEVGLLNLKEEKAASLSSGERARLALAMGLYKDPFLLSVDEPFAYLDMDNQKRLLQIFREEGKKRLVLVATHELPEGLGSGEELASAPFALIREASGGKLDCKARMGRAYAPRVTMGCYAAIMCAFLALAPTLPSLSYPFHDGGADALSELAQTLYLEHAPFYEVDSPEAPLLIEMDARDSGYGKDAFAFVAGADPGSFETFYALQEGRYPSSPGEFLVPSLLLEDFLREYSSRASLPYEEAASSFLGAKGSLFDPDLTPVGVYESPDLSALDGFVMAKALRNDEPAYVAAAYALVTTKETLRSSSTSCVGLVSRESCPGGEGVASGPALTIASSLTKEHPSALSIPLRARLNNPLYGRNDRLLSSWGALPFVGGSYLLAVLFPLAFYLGYRNRYLALLMVGAPRARLFARGALYAGLYALVSVIAALLISLACSLLPGFFLSSLFETSLFMARYDGAFFLLTLPAPFIGFLLTILAFRLLLPRDVMAAIRRKEG